MWVYCDWEAGLNVLQDQTLETLQDVRPELQWTESFRQHMRDFLGTRIMTVDLKHVGTTAQVSRMLKRSTWTFTSCQCPNDLG